MSKDIYIYPALFSFDPDGISIEFPDLPGCLSCAHTEEEAFKCAKEALELHLYGMEEDGEELPEPSSVSNLVVEKNQAVVLVEAWMLPFREKMATKAVNKTVTLPKWLIELGDKHNVNYSQVLQTSLKDQFKIYDYRHIKKSK